MARAMGKQANYQAPGTAEGATRKEGKSLAGQAQGQYARPGTNAKLKRRGR